MRTLTNRQMAARLKKLGFEKSRMQMTRHGLSYKHPDSSALFTFGKSPDSGIMVTAPDDKGWSMAFLSQEAWSRIQQNEWVQFPLDLTSNPAITPMSPREILLCVARGFADMLEEEPWGDEE